MPEDNVLVMENVCKSFPGVRALKGVTLSCARGEIHGLVGENGAGKSTLMKILAGAYTADSGQILIRGEPCSPSNPIEAMRLGIRMIYQDMDLLPFLTVRENILLGREKRRWRVFIDKEAERREASKALEMVRSSIGLDTFVGELTVGQQQLVQIAKALLGQSDILVLDEPGVALTDHELKGLFALLQALKDRGVTVVYISHRLKELYGICDRITVLKDGEVVATVRPAETKINELVNMMVGRVLEEELPKRTSEPSDEIVMEARGVALGRQLRGVDLLLRRGEIVGVAGLRGAGKSELARVLFGSEKPDRGEVLIRREGPGKKVGSISGAIAAGMAFASEDRKREGVILEHSVRHNVALATLAQRAKAGFIRRKSETKTVCGLVDELAIKTPSLAQEVQYLSGGNQQKIVLAKWLAGGPSVIILEEPTIGIDVGTKFEIYRLLGQLADQGKSIVLLSSELIEIVGLSDRILVLYEGSIAVELPRGSSEEDIVLAMTGHAEAISGHGSETTRPGELEGQA